MQHEQLPTLHQPTQANDAAQRLPVEADGHIADANAKSTGWITTACDALQQHEHIRQVQRDQISPLAR